MTDFRVTEPVGLNPDEVAQVIQDALEEHFGLAEGSVRATQITGPRTPTHVLLAGDLIEGHDAYVAYSELDAQRHAGRFNRVVIMPAIPVEE